MKHLFITLLLTTSISIKAQISFIQFDQAPCPVTVNSTYTFTNYAYNEWVMGNIVYYHGYKIFKDSVEVFDNMGTNQSGLQCRHLFFINDSVGFSIIDQTTYWGFNRVFKTTDYGHTWTFVGGSGINRFAGNFDYLGFYIINAHVAYLLTSDYGPSVKVTRCSDTSLPTDIIYDINVNNDISRTDTIIDSALCNINQLSFSVKHDSDTVNYYIPLTYINVGIQNQSISYNDLIVYPNPTSSYFKIADNEHNLNKVSILQANGQLLKQFSEADCKTNYFSISELTHGFYLIKIVKEDHEVYRKLLINK